MLQEPKNYHLIGDFSSYRRIFDEGHTFCVFDTETTGLKAEEERIIEIGAVKFDKTGFIGQFGTLIDPEKEISSKITSITGITNGMLSGQPKAEEAVPNFMDFAKDCILVAHNAPFDLRFMNCELMRLGRPTITSMAIDTLKFARWAYPEFGHWNQPFLAEALGVKITSAHRAYDDARVCMEIFRKMLDCEKLKKKTTNRLN